ncbi:hypothetical protein ACHAXR_006089 [Thalassiosira sp. AJA248-18]
MTAFRMMAAWTLALAATTASAFQSTSLSPINRSTKMTSLPSPPLHRHHSIIATIHQSTQNVQEEEEEEYEMVEFIISPEQLITLRKEAIKREARKKLPKFFLPPDGDGASPETINDISSLFDTSELIEVRGVSKDAKKRVFDTAHGLAASLEDKIEKPVVVVDIKGFAVKLYCPWVGDEGGDSTKIQLRNSYKPGQWTRKAKPIRDNRGQIIMDENGKSIKEIPE